MEEKNNNKYLIVIILLTVLVFCLAGYIVWDKTGIGEMLASNNNSTPVEEKNIPAETEEPKAEEKVPPVEEETPKEEKQTEESSSKEKSTNPVPYGKKYADKTGVLSESEALLVGQDLWDYAYSAYWGGVPAWNTRYDHDLKESVCDPTAEQVKREFTSDFKFSNCIGDNHDECYVYKIEDFVHASECHGAGRGGLQYYNDTVLKIKEIQADKIVYTSISSYCSDACLVKDVPKDIKLIVEKDFVIKKVDGNWLIAEYYLPN